MYVTTLSAVGASLNPFESPPPLNFATLSAFSTDGTTSKRESSHLQLWSSFIGIITAIVGNILISFALNIQRYAHIRIYKEQQERQERSKKSSQNSKNGYGTASTNNGNGHPIRHADRHGEETEPLTSSFNSDGSDYMGCQDGDHAQETTYLRSPYWWAGIMLMTIGETGNFLAYGFAPASIVSPLGVVALVSNCVIAPFMLKERFRWRDFWGVVVAVGGAVTVVLSAKQKEEKLGPQDVIGAITTTEFEVYMGVTFVLMAALAWASPRYGSRTILIDLGLVGLFGGYTALSTKGVASMLSSTLWKAFTTPITYALIAVLAGTAIMQVKYVNKALQRFDSTQVIPVQFVMFTLSVIIGSAVLYRDFEETSLSQVGKFVGGCLLTFFGVFLITSGRDRQMDNEHDYYNEDSEERIGLAAHDSNGMEGFYQEGNLKYTNGNQFREDVQDDRDGVEDDEDDNDPVDQSRRSSRVSFAPSTIRLGDAGMSSYPTQNLSVERIPPAGALRNPLTANSPLLSNPWRLSQDDLLALGRPSGISSMTSSPILPSEAQTQSLSTESLRPTTPRASSQEHFHTHPNNQDPNGPPQADYLRPVTPAARHSISRMMPGPFISPLSSSLSAVVADTMRRQEAADSPSRYRSFRRPRLSIRRRTGLERQGSESESDGGPSQSRSLGSRAGEELMRSRARSLSNALGEFLRGKRSRKDGGDEYSTPGPSGQ